MEYRVPENMKASDALKNIYPDSSRRSLQTWIENGRFHVDGAPLRHENQPLKKGQIINSQDTFRPPKVPGLKILFEDRYLIAIDKPIGLLSVPLDEGKHKKHALGLLRQHYDTDQIYAVHRIDRETSGVLMFARGKEAEERFKELFERHDMRREYFAIVEGRLKEDRGTWTCGLMELPSLRVVESPEGKDSITHFEVVRRSAKYTYLRLELETGRKHQIRVHCQRAGHPVLGDGRYGSQQNPIRRLCLHSYLLEFKHPFTKKIVSFNAPLPFVFKKLGGEISL